VFLADTTVDPFAPEVETAAFERLSHQGNHIRFSKPKLKQNGFKRSPVLPCHLNDAVLVDWVHGDDNNCLLKLLGIDWIIGLEMVRPGTLTLKIKKFNLKLNQLQFIRSK